MLDVSNNNLSGQVDLMNMAPYSSGQNTNLRTLNASHNYLSSISYFNNLGSLAELDFQGCTYKIYTFCDNICLMIVIKNDRIREQNKRFFS